MQDTEVICMQVPDYQQKYIDFLSFLSIPCLKSFFLINNVKGFSPTLKCIMDYDSNQGILLDSSKITSNPANIQMSKLFLNSFGEKFLREVICPKTESVTVSQEFFTFMLKKKKKVSYFYFYFLGDRLAMVHWTYSNRYISPHDKANTYDHIMLYTLLSTSKQID